MITTATPRWEEYESLSRLKKNKEEKIENGADRRRS
jgi:hypothetical protein